MMLFTVALLVAIVAANAKLKVIVTGAAGRTGSLVFQKLLESQKYDPIALVRTDSSKKDIKKLGGKDDQIVAADITNEKVLERVFQGAHAVVLCTSAKPKIKPLSIVKVFIAKLFNKSNVRPEFTFPPNGDPYFVDWLGAKNQIDAAKADKVKKIVVVSSMGGTQPDNFLNTIGKREGDEKSGNILIWKRKAEKYLIDSGLDYTIIHPGGLIDKEGGKATIIMDFDDRLLQRTQRTINRADVAEVAVQSIDNPNAKKRSFDIISEVAKSPQEITTDWNAFFRKNGNNKY
jgi:uncharacterized protein YbjT (DUF2867 family)